MKSPSQLNRFYSKCYEIIYFVGSNCFPVPRSVLREQYEERPEKDETLEPEQDIDTYDVVDDALREGSVYSASPNLGVGQPAPNNVSGGPSPSEAPPKYHTADPSIRGRFTNLA